MNKFGTVLITYSDGSTKKVENAQILMGLNGNVAVKTEQGVTVAAGNITADRE